MEDRLDKLEVKDHLRMIHGAFLSICMAQMVVFILCIVLMIIFYSYVTELNVVYQWIRQGQNMSCYSPSVF